MRSAVLCLITQLCLNLCDPVDCSPPGFSVHGDSPCKNTAMPSSRGSSQPRDQTQVSCIVGRFFTAWATREGQALSFNNKKEESRFICFIFRNGASLSAIMLEVRFAIANEKTERSDQGFEKCEMLKFEIPVLERTDSSTKGTNKLLSGKCCSHVTFLRSMLQNE